MNIFELMLFGIHCVAGYLIGSLLGAWLGTIGWAIGIPLGFSMSLGCVWFAVRLFRRKP